MSTKLATVWAYITGHRVAFSFAGAALFYAACTLFYMGGAAANCSQSLLTFPGDNTAGMIALFSIDNHDPWWGYTSVFSYPYGELIGQPTHITAQVLFIPFWMLAKLFGPVCGFNILTMIGFMSAAMTMFAFMRWLTGGRILVPLIAGFAVAFTPYLQIKTGVHLSYVFEAFFIAAIWAFLYFWRQPTWKRAVLLGLSVALLAYIDGYFILMGGVLMAALVTATLVFEVWRRKHPAQKWRRTLGWLALAVGVAVAGMAPVAYVQLKSSADINQSLVSTRDSIDREAQVYGARPLEYLTPNAFNPLFSDVFGAYQERDNHGSNPAENVLSLSLVMVVAALFFIGRVAWGIHRKQPVTIRGLRLSSGAVAFIFGIVALIALLVSLPPKLGPVPTPSYLVIEIIELWRVFARLSVVVNIALVIVGSCGLILLLEYLKSRRRQLIAASVVLLLIFLEYLTFTPPRPVSGYENVPGLYHWLSAQSDYQEIAEYPLDEFAASHYPVFYNSYQRIHHKKMLNGVISNDQAIFARRALQDLTNPQTVPGLRTLGIDFITVHGTQQPADISGLRLVYKSAEPLLNASGKKAYVWGYTVLPGPKADYVAAPIEGFHAPVQEGPKELQKMGHKGVVSVRPLMDIRKSGRTELQLQLRSISPQGQKVKIVQSDRELWNGVVSPETMALTLDVESGQDIHIISIDPQGDATLLMPTISVKQSP